VIEHEARFGMIINKSVLRHSSGGAATAERPTVGVGGQETGGLARHAEPHHIAADIRKNGQPHLRVGR
jgi:hypothetical protein